MMLYFISTKNGNRSWASTNGEVFRQALIEQGFYQVGLIEYWLHRLNLLQTIRNWRNK